MITFPLIHFVVIHWDLDSKKCSALMRNLNIVDCLCITILILDSNLVVFDTFLQKWSLVDKVQSFGFDNIAFNTLWLNSNVYFWKKFGKRHFSIGVPILHLWTKRGVKLMEEYNHNLKKKKRTAKTVFTSGLK